MNKDQDNIYAIYAIYGVAGIQLAASVIAGLIFGNYLDKQLHIHPILTIIGLVLGFVGGFYNLFKIINWKQNQGTKSGC